MQYCTALVAIKLELLVSTSRMKPVASLGLALSFGMATYDAEEIIQLDYRVYDRNCN